MSTTTYVFMEKHEKSGSGGGGGGRGGQNSFGSYLP